MWSRVRQGFGAIVEDGRRIWPVYLVFLAIATLAAIRVFGDHTPRIPLLFNWTPSLPYRVAWLERGNVTVHRGDFVLYRFQGSAVKDYPGLENQPFFKIVAGVPGDAIEVRDRDVFVAGQFVGHAKTSTFDGRPLSPIASGRIPEGSLYVRGTSPDSLDSRYTASGLVRADLLIGRVRPWL